MLCSRDNQTVHEKVILMSVKYGILLQNLTTVCICFLSICSAQLQESAVSKNVTKNFSKPNTDINPPHLLCLWFAHWEILSSPLNAPKRSNLSLSDTKQSGDQRRIMSTECLITEIEGMTCQDPH
jgi:uncharacterized membrane protein